MREEEEEKGEEVSASFRHHTHTTARRRVRMGNEKTRVGQSQAVRDGGGCVCVFGKGGKRENRRTNE